MITQSDTLRGRIAHLESALASASAAVVSAEATHRDALRRAIVTDSYDRANRAAEKLQAARSDYTATQAALTEARDMLAEAVAAERAAKEVALRAEIDAELADLAQLADAADADFASLLGRARQLQAREIAIHRRLNSELQIRPTAAPSIGSRILRTAGIALGTEANGVAVDVRPIAAEALQASARNIERAFSA